MRLPPLDVNQKREEAESSLKLPEIDLLHVDEEREKFKEHFKEFIMKDEVVLNKDNKDKYEDVRGTYRNIIGMFQSKEDNLLKIYEIELSKIGIHNTEDLEKAIENGSIDMNKYDTFTVNKLLQKLERTQPPENLESYNIKTIEEFYVKVTSGEIDVSKYEENELDKFIDSLI